MGATIGKNSDTGMMTLTFDSTGRTSQFTKEETIDLEKRLQLIKMEGRMNSESIGSKAVFILQQLGEAIEEGDIQTVEDIWLNMGQKIVEEGVLNKIIKKVKPDNPFALYMDAPNLTKEDIRRAINVSNKVKEIILNLVGKIGNLRDTSDICQLLHRAAEDIREYYDQRVGLSDTEARECIASYFKDRLVEIHLDGDVQIISDEFSHSL